MALLEPFISRKDHSENMDDVREHTFEELCRIVGAIAAAYGMRRVYLFGSRARGDSTADSDYDFFVVPVTTAGCSGSPGSSASYRRPSATWMSCATTPLRERTSERRSSRI